MAAVAVEVSRMMPLELLPAITPPLPAVEAAALRLPPVAMITRSPVRSGSLVIPVPTAALVATPASAVASTPPTPMKPTATPRALAVWLVSAVAATVTLPAGKRTLSPILAVTAPALVARDVAPMAPMRTPPAPAVAVARAVMPDVPGTTLPSTTSSAAVIVGRPMIGEEDNASAVTIGLAVALDDATPSAPPPLMATPSALDLAKGTACAVIDTTSVACSLLEALA